jgi:hypothetical protein
MARLATQPLPPCGHWRYELPQTVSITGKMFPGLSHRSSLFHEPMAVGQGEATLGCLAPYWMDCSLADWLSSATQTPRVVQLHIRVHDGDEVGPGLLAQIAKKTGLQPEDL